MVAVDKQTYFMVGKMIYYFKSVSRYMLEEKPIRRISPSIFFERCNQQRGNTITLILCLQAAGNLPQQL